MNAANDNRSAESSPRALKNSARQRSPLDERVFMAIVLVGIVAMVAVMLFTFPGKGREEPLREFRQVARFQLIERSGRIVREADLKGKIVIVDFFFGGCSAQCLTLGQQMAELQRLTAAMDEVMLLSITVDPESDTPQALTSYANHIKADTHRWLFLTGDKKTIYSLIRQSFLLAAADDNSHPSSLDPGFIHSDKIALVDKRGVVRAYYDGMDASTPQTVLAGIKQLLTESKTH